MQGRLCWSLDQRGDLVALRVDDDDLVVLDDEGMRLDLRHFGRNLDRHRLKRNTLRDHLADLGGDLRDLVLRRADLKSLRMISLMTCRCSIVRLTVSAVCCDGEAGAGIWATAGRATISIAAKTATKRRTVNCP